MKASRILSFSSLARTVIATAVSFMFLTVVSVTDVAAQGRSNKGGEVRGKDRATQVQEMNSSAREEGDKKEKKLKKDKKEKKAKKPKKEKRGKKK